MKGSGPGHRIIRILVRTFTVSQINSYIKDMLQSDLLLKNVSISGEVSDLTVNAFSGHAYFTLKDEYSRIKSVFFAGSRKKCRTEIRSGMHITASGKIDLYEPSGQYQLIVYGIREEGAGKLMEEFLEKKARLEEAGLFDAQFKKAIPAHPRLIGVVTSETGAVIRDIVRTAWRRNPSVNIVLSPALVQGAEAPQSLIAALKRLQKTGADTIIIGRGGGSFEDLNSFNDEALAAAIFSCPIPVISAVGHETDFTIADFTADLRAATPTAAAELAVPDAQALADELDILKNTLQNLTENFYLLGRAHLENMLERLRQHRPRLLVEKQRQHLDMLSDRLSSLIRQEMTRRKSGLEYLQATLSAHNPSAPLEKGYAWLTSETGRAIRRIEALTPEQNIRILLKGGTAGARITETTETKGL